jgi:AraC-like DNA-binding protein
MKFYFKFDFNVACKKILQEQMDKLGVVYTLTGMREVEVKNISKARLRQLSEDLNGYGIEIVESQKSILVQKIKDAIIEMVYLDEKLPTSKISVHLAEKLNYSYGYLSNLFSEVTYTSIENFIILQKTERAKQLITTTELSVTEIAWELNYSSVSHFCTQFKSATGLTPTVFQKIIRKRQKNLVAENTSGLIISSSPEV